MKKKAATFFFSSRVWQIWDTYKKCIKSCFQKILKGFLFWCNILVLTEPNRERNHLILSWIAPPTSANNLDYSQHKSSKYLVNYFSQPVSNGLSKICTSTVPQMRDLVVLYYRYTDFTDWGQTHWQALSTATSRLQITSEKAGLFIAQVDFYGQICCLFVVCSR